MQDDKDKYRCTPLAYCPESLHESGMARNRTNYQRLLDRKSDALSISDNVVKVTVEINSDSRSIN